MRRGACAPGPWSRGRGNQPPGSTDLGTCPLPDASNRPGCLVDEDARLVELAQAGKAEAFGQLVTKYQDRLYTVIARVTGSPDDARELTQDALVRAFVKLETFAGASTFYTWLYRIGVNLALSHRRRNRATVSLDAARAGAGWEPVDGETGPAERLESDERARQVRAALDQLSPEHRAILVLREIDGCDYEQLAEILGLALGTVRSRLHRARLELKARLEPLLDYPTRTPTTPTRSSP